MIDPCGTNRNLIEENLILQQRIKALEKSERELQLVKEELQWKTALLDAQLDSYMDGLLVVDADRKRVLANRRLCELYKIPKHILEDEDEIARLNYFASLAKNPEQFYERITKIYEQPTMTSRDVIEFKSGRVLDMYSAPVLGKNGFYYGRLWAFRDITEQKRAEEALVAKNQQLMDTIEFFPDATIVIDQNNKIVAWNRALEEMSGASKEDLIGKESHAGTIPFYGDKRPFLLDLIDASDEELESKYKYVRRKGNTLYAEAFVPTLYGGRGAHIWMTGAPLFDADGNRTGAIESVRDITDYIKVLKALQESQRKFADIIDFLPDATLVIDGEGRIVAWNRAMESMTGIRAEEMIGKGDYEYALPFYGERRPMLIDLALYPDKDKDKHHYTSIQKIGDILFGEAFTPGISPGDVHLSATASVLRDSQGETVAAIECFRDNTERKKLEERLSRAEKMEGLGRLAGGVAHDLNNVLGILVGYSELLLDMVSKDSILKKYAENIYQSGIRGAAIVQDLLTLARRGVTVAEVVNLNKVVTNYLKTPEFEKLALYHPDVRIITNLENGLMNIKGSPVHLGKTLMNLVSNAAEAIAGPGEIMIRTENLSLDTPIKSYEALSEGDYAVLTVSDTGGGISTDDLGKIFEPFYTKKVMGRSGTGLGLAVVWGTVKDHKGYIDVQSKEGKGTTFKLYFPLTSEQEKEENQDAVSHESYVGRGESILVVDDVPGQRELALNMLSRLGYCAKAVANGEAAVAYLRENKVDLIVLDMIMDPGMDGLETYRQILELHPNQKAIIVSGFSQTERVRKTQELGAGAYVRKPYIMECLGIAVRKELDRSR